MLYLIIAILIIIILIILPKMLDKIEYLQEGKDWDEESILNQNFFKKV